MLPLVVTLDVPALRSRQVLLPPATTRFLAHVFSTTSSILFPQLLSFHIHAKKHPGWGPKTKQWRRPRTAASPEVQRLPATYFNPVTTHETVKHISPACISSLS